LVIYYNKTKQIIIVGGCEGVEDVVPQLRSVGCSNNVYEDYERLIEKTNNWLRDQPDVNIVNLQSILVQKDTTGALIN